MLAKDWAHASYDIIRSMLRVARPSQHLGMKSQCVPGIDMHLGAGRASRSGGGAGACPGWLAAGIS